VFAAAASISNEIALKPCSSTRTVTPTMTPQRTSRPHARKLSSKSRHGRRLQLGHPERNSASQLQRKTQRTQQSKTISHRSVPPHTNPQLNGLMPSPSYAAHPPTCLPAINHTFASMHCNQCQPFAPPCPHAPTRPVRCISAPRALHHRTPLACAASTPTLIHHAPHPWSHAHRLHTVRHIHLAQTKTDIRNSDHVKSSPAQ
jgi:hypothetical protein